MTIMVDPMVLNCGHSFEKSAIEDWLEMNNICPICRKDVISIVPNYTLKTMLKYIQN